MSALSTEGIVLRKVDFRETSQILTVLTPDRGKIDVIAKGIKGKKGKPGTPLDLLFHADVTTLRPKRGEGLELLTEVRIKNSFPSLRRDPDLLNGALLALEIARDLFPAEDANEEAYRLFLITLSTLDEGHPAEPLLFWFEVRLLSLLGFFPEIERCMHCRKELPATVLSLRLGGVLCRDCRKQDPAAMPFSPSAQAAIRHLTKTLQPARLKLSDALLGQVRRALRTVTSWVLEREPRLFKRVHPQ